MSTGLLLQYAVIALLVAASVWTALRKLAPVTTARLQASAAASLLRPQRGALVQRVGRWLQPKGATGDCGDGCGTCGTCGPSDPNVEQTITFHPPRK
ncbi:hypothetical protein DIE14_34095 [Burkholderia sp. Bp9017]|uniref:Transmembrane protein n=1 Tax=Burkholderia anthina TaxID=179879 RepID=A0A7T6VIK1_9BURK|nr:MULTISPECIES: DUF6587 family protein [Burkholderia]MBY4868556.1 hypothetical protein [Burkholderia anthina]QQK04599.1 hypothetical protein JFN94_24985 [Burkholderia anthina]RQZ14734.1 hypothetical protein DIE14_34095 [Burkholderia sp. Bp9017]RQZ26578.1 hypothetical protein DIE13_30635 [Burkholderia sp. Bp9016]